MGIVSYTAPAKWSKAILEDNWEGLSTKEEQACLAWLRSLPGNVEFFVSTSNPHLDTQNLKHHDAFEYYPYTTDCYEYLVTSGQPS